MNSNLSFTTADHPNMKFGQMKKFYPVKKFYSNLRCLNTVDLRNMKYGEMKKFHSAIENWLKVEIFDLRNKFGQRKEFYSCWKFDMFDHRGPAKCEIWGSEEIESNFRFLTCEIWNLSPVETLTKIWDFMCCCCCFLPCVFS